MSKKQEENPPLTNDTELAVEQKTTPKKRKRKSEPKSDDTETVEDSVELKTLYELVTSSDMNRTDLVFILEKNGLMNQFYDEERKVLGNKYVIPTISEDEFKKIIGG